MDPVLSVPIPTSSSKPVLFAAHALHLQAACQASDVLTASPPAPARLTRCAQRLAARGSAATHVFRQAALLQFEDAASSLMEASASLVAAAEPHVQAVLKASSSSLPHPALLRHCLEAIHYHDVSVVDDLLAGFPLVGDIPADSSAESKQVRSIKLDQASLEAQGPSRFSRMVDRQRRSFSKASKDDLQAVFDQTLSEIALGRMSPLVPLSESPTSLVTRRFPVEQVDSKGRRKVRSIDDFAESRVNDSCSVSRRIRMGRLSDIAKVASLLHASGHHDLRLLKSDFKSAYRGCPILSGHLHLARVLVQSSEGDIFTSGQLAMPFGSVAAVYAWDRVGAALSAILIELFDIPCSRYVDDLFWVDFSSTSSSCRTLALRVISLLGFTLEPEKTPEPSLTLDILGITVSLQQCAEGLCLLLLPEARKVAVWMSSISSSLDSGALHQKAASKLAGRLSFAAWSVWGPLARSRLRHLYIHSLRGDTAISSHLSKDLRWWLSCLETLPALRLPLWRRSDPVAVVYSDAEGSGGVGAFLQVASKSAWLAGSAPRSFSAVLFSRKTQIFAYETLMVLVTISCFLRDLRGLRVIFFVDNTSALGALRKGSSRSADVHALVEEVWRLAGSNDISLFFKWVPSKLNLADPPSRGSEPISGHRAHLRFHWDSLSLRVRACCA